MADFLSKITKFLIPEEVEEIEAKVDEKQETRRQTVKVAPNVTRVAMDLPFTQIQLKLQEMKQHHLLLITMKKIIVVLV